MVRNAEQMATPYRSRLNRYQSHYDFEHNGNGKRQQIDCAMLIAEKFSLLQSLNQY